MKNINSIILFCILLLEISVSSVSAEERWFTSIYAGKFSDNALNEIIRAQTKLEDSYVYVLSVGRELGTLKHSLGMELEGQFGWHSGEQDHGELNAVFTLRWLPFPWDRYLDTSFAFGNGMSYAFVEPELEIIDNEENKTSQWLYYLLVELSAQVPKVPQWDMFIRIHHRSSVWKLVGGYDAGSNFLGIGLRYRFQ